MIYDLFVYRIHYSGSDDARERVRFETSLDRFWQRARLTSGYDEAPQQLNHLCGGHVGSAVCARLDLSGEPLEILAVQRARHLRAVRHLEQLQINKLNSCLIHINRAK